MDKAIAALQGVSGNGRRSVAKKRGRPHRKKRTMSAAARKRLSRLLKERWASGKMKRRRKVKAASKQKQRGGITAAGRKRLSEMMKKRWAEKRKKAKSV